MIYEYAVDPSIISTWCQRTVGRFFIGEFGVGRPRIISQFPRSWKTLVWQEFRQSCYSNDLNQARMREILKYVSDKTVKRTDLDWDNRKSWLENAEMEHSFTPFDAIIAKNNPRSHERVICADSVEHHTPLWYRPRHQIQSREAQELQELVSPMLRIATTILFIDPYFGTESRYLKPLKCYLKMIVRQGLDGRIRRGNDARIPHIEIHRSEKSAHWCASDLAQIVPYPLKLKVLTLKPRTQGQDLHNRYILTDVGGLQFGHGLDEGAAGSTDDVTLLEVKSYRNRWEQYANGAHAFEHVKTERIGSVARS